MAVKDQIELLKALEDRRFDDILGTAECYWLDFKQAGYATEPGKPQKLSDHGKSELCKDIAEFANHKGGIILLGVKEAKSLENGLSVADKIRLLAVASIDLQHYKQVFMAQIYPLVEDVEMRWFSDDKGKGLLAVIIPKSRNDTLHIVRQVYDAEGVRIRGLEIPVRADDQTYLYTAEALSERINGQALGVNPVSSPMQSTLSQGPAPPEVIQNFHERQKKNEDEARSIRNQLIGMNDWGETPVLCLQVIPDAAKDRLDGFYDTLKQAFNYTKPVRGMGFNLNSFGRETSTVDGAFVKAGARDGVIRLDPNGTMTLVLAATPDFLGWGVNRDSMSDHMKINSIVLAETTLEFARFTVDILKPAGLNTWRYCIDLRDLKKNKVALYTGRPGGWHDDLQVASKDVFETIVPGSEDYEADTYKMLTEIYAHFALPEKSIPYTADEKVTVKNIQAIDASGR